MTDGFPASQHTAQPTPRECRKVRLASSTASFAARLNQRKSTLREKQSVQLAEHRQLVFLKVDDVNLRAIEDERLHFRFITV